MSKHIFTYSNYFFKRVLSKTFLPLFILLTYLFSMQETNTQNKNVIYIYNDSGVSKECLTQTIAMFNNKYLVKTIDAQDVKDGFWAKDALLFIIPGGADLPYVEKLKSVGVKNIKQYVNNGGSFLGICAGSYYGSSFVEFDKNGPLEVLGDRELGFFKGKAIGPILAPYDYKTTSGSRAATVCTIFDKVPQTVVYYNGGGFFENAEKFSNTKVIAFYENKLPAIISIAYGKGIVVLSGVHFEYDPSLLDSRGTHIKQIINQLNAHNNSRKILQNQLLNILRLSKPI